MKYDVISSYDFTSASEKQTASPVGILVASESMNCFVYLVMDPLSHTLDLS